MIVVFFAVSLLASIVGSICGIGGGVIIKPVLDAMNVMSVSCISFLSGCTVLTMSVVSVYKNMRAGKKLNIRIATLLAVGAAVGGVAGKMMFVAVKTSVGNENFVGMVQAIVLIGVTGITFVYTIFKKKIHTLTLNNAAVCVVLASDGYPVKYEKEIPMYGFENFKDKEGYYCFHAGTKFKGGQIVTNGGRVVGITATGSDLKEARKNAYAATEWITFANKYMRHDIGKAIDEA